MKCIDMHGKGSGFSAENELKGACVDLWCNDEVGRWKCKGEMLK